MTDRFRALQVDRGDLARTRLVEPARLALADGEVRLHTDLVGLSTNNVTYAALGDAFRYWDHFPTGDPQWGSVPVWGFADVVESRADAVGVGERYFGYLPSAEEVVVTPSAHDIGFRDVAAHRTGLPSSYLSYSRTSTDPTYDADREPLHAVYRPLFWTSLMLADRTEDRHRGATALITSASAKTAYLTALLLDAPTIGVTSPRNRAFVIGTGLYDQVLTYGEPPSGDDSVVVLDFLGDDAVARRLAEQLGPRHRERVVVGITDQTSQAAGDLDHSAAIFFAPDQMRKRLADWGRAGVEERYAAAWARFAEAAPRLVDVVEHTGFERLPELWSQLQRGDVDPSKGIVLQLEV